MSAVFSTSFPGFSPTRPTETLDPGPAFSKVSLSLSLRRAVRREPWERGCCFLRLRLTVLNIFLEFTFRVILKKKKGFSPVWLT